MSSNLRRFKNAKTGEVIIFKWDGPGDPTPSDIAEIKRKRDIELSRPAPKVSLPQKIGAKIYEGLAFPSEKLITAPVPETREETEKRPFISRVGRKTQEVAHGLVSPENIATTTAATAMGPAGLAGLSAYYGTKMATEVPGAAQQFIEHPSFETGTDLALTTGGTVLAGAGFKAGMKSYGKPTPAPKVQPPPTEVPLSRAEMLTSEMPKVSLPPEQTGPIDVEVMPRGKNLPPSTIPALPPKQGVLPARGERPVRGEGFTMGGPKVVIPTIERPVEVSTAPIKGEGFVARPSTFEEAPIAPPAVVIPQPPTKVVPPKVEIPGVKAIQQPLENEWLRQQETDALEIMRKGAKGDLAKEIDIALEERGIKAPKSVGRVSEQGATSGAEEGYNQSLKSLEGLAEFGGPEDIRGAIAKGKAAGRTKDQIVADLLKIGVPEKMALINATRMFRPKEAGFWTPFSNKPKLAETLSGEAGPDSVKNDVNNLETVLGNLYIANPDAIVKHGAGTTGASELSRLLKLQRSLGNTAAGAYKAHLAENGLKSDRVGRIDNVSDAEFSGTPGSVVDVLANNAVPASPSIKAAADAIQRVNNELWKRAEKVDIPVKDTLVDKLEETGDREVLFNYITDLTSEIVTREVLGKEKLRSPLVKGYLEDIKKGGGNERLAEVYARQILDSERADPFHMQNQAVSSVMSKISTAVYLPFFAISDMANLATLGMRGNISKMLPAMVHNLLLKNRMSPANIRSGALNEFITDSLAPESTISKLYGIRKAEQYLRATAAETGRGTAVDLLEGLKAGTPGSYSYKVRYARLKNLLLKNDTQMDALISHGKLNSKELDLAGGRMAELTQGLTDPVDLPYEWTKHAESRIVDYVLTYKRFAYVGSKNIIEAFKEDPVRAGAVLATLSPVVGEIVGDAKSALKGALASIFTDESAADAMIREIEDRGKFIQRLKIFKDHPKVARYFTDIIDSWTLGLIGDMALAASSGEGEIAKWFAGPRIALISEVIHSLYTIPGEIYKNYGKGFWDQVEGILKNAKNLAPGRMGPAIERSAKAPEKND